MSPPRVHVQTFPRRRRPWFKTWRGFLVALVFGMTAGYLAALLSNLVGG